MMTKNEQKAWEEYLAKCEEIQNSTTPTKNETEKEKKTRIKSLTSDFVKFCKYYFGNWMDSDFGWFHKKAAKEITERKNGIFVLEWAREHAKSVFSCVFMPMFLKARGEFTGMVLVSANADKAKGLLSDIQAQLSSNQKFIADFGQQVHFGDWRSGEFMTKDGCGFWSFGRGQSPRGIRKNAKRPNLAIVDDIDDKKIVKNQARVQEAVDWIWEDLYPAMPIKGCKLIFAGNRIHPKSILAHVVGDIDEHTPKNKKIVHIKVYAIEDQYHRASWFGQKGARPAWKERYIMKALKEKFSPMPESSVQGEYFHKHIPKGTIFKRDWIHYVKPLKKSKYKGIVFYCDPSFKDTKASDTKAIIGIGKTKDGKIDILHVWVRRTSIKNMVGAFYDSYGMYESYANYWIEANMLQDLFLDEFDTEAEERGYNLPIRKDKRKKPDKVTRIMNLEPLFQRGKIRISEDLKGSPDLQTFFEQLFSFPFGINDDAPDALEGAIIKINKSTKTSNFKPRFGNYNQSRR